MSANVYGLPLEDLPQVADYILSSSQGKAPLEAAVRECEAQGLVRLCQDDVEYGALKAEAKRHLSPRYEEMLLSYHFMNISREFYGEVVKPRLDALVGRVEFIFEIDSPKYLL
ncbi:MAG: hypothetical protein ABIH41_01605 [Nanoarchaeota archaeon]